MITPEDVLAERERLGLSRAKFAALIGMKPGALQSIEKKTRPIKDKDLLVLEPYFSTRDAQETPVELRASAPDAHAQPVVLLNTELEDPDYEELYIPASVSRTPEAMQANAIRFSNSEIQTWKRCRRKWYFSYFLKLRLKAEPVLGPRRLGTQVHAALEAWYVPEGMTKLDPEQALEKVLVDDWDKVVANADADAGGPDPETVKDYKNQCDLARAMVSGYMEWISETGIDQDLEIIAPERKLVKTISEGVELIGKLDVEARRRSDGARLFIDHKTVVNLTTPMRTLHLDEQVLTYMLLQKLDAAGEEQTAGALYNMLRKVKRGPRAKPPFYERVQVNHNPTEIDSFLQRLHGTVQDILLTMDALLAGTSHLEVAYPTPHSNCSWDCDFLAVCSMMDDGSRVDDFLGEMYETGNPLARYEDHDESKGLE